MLTFRLGVQVLETVLLRHHQSNLSSFLLLFQTGPLVPIGYEKVKNRKSVSLVRRKGGAVNSSMWRYLMT